MGSISALYVPWVVCFMALVAWGGVGFFAWSLSYAEEERAAAAASLAEETALYDSTLQIHVLARETKEARTVLDSLARTDVISIVEALEAVGDDAHTTIEIGQILTKTVTSEASSAEPAVQAVTIVVEAQGTFATLLHVAALLYSLPIPSVIDQLQLDRLSKEADTNEGSWWLAAHIRVLTTAQISS